MLNRPPTFFVDDKGRAWPITEWFDDVGDYCDPEDAVSAVAGGGNTWFALDLRNMEQPTVQ